MKKLFRKLFPNKEMRAYCKMHRRHRRELIKHAKATYEWGWDWLHDSVIMQIRHMYEYYSNGNNVWQDNEKRRLMILEQLKHILDLDEEINKMQDEDYGVQYIHSNGKLKAIFPNDYKQRIIDYEKKEQELYEKLYSSIGRDLRWWWD